MFALKKDLVLSLLMLILLLVTASLLPSISFAKPVALNVVVADEIAIQSATSEIIQRLFADRLPEVEFRRVVVPAQSPLIPQLFSDKARVHAELKEKLASVLRPGDELTYLILDTHGATKNPQDKSNPADAGRTILFHLGEVGTVGGGSGVDSSFADLFDQVRPYAAKDLVIIMNACSVFSGNENRASLRAQALLDYFRAPNGTVYGSKVPEIDTFAFSKYGTRSDFLPTRKMFWVMNSLGLVMASTLAAAVVQGHDGNPYAYFVGSYLAIQAISYLRPLISRFSDAMKWVNVGYLFRFRNGKLFKSEQMQKMKNLARSFALPARCEALFR